MNKLIKDLTPQELLDMKINQAIQQLEEVKQLLLSLKKEKKA